MGRLHAKANSRPRGTRTEAEARAAAAAGAKRRTLRQKRREGIKARTADFLAAKEGR